MQRGTSRGRTAAVVGVGPSSIVAANTATDREEEHHPGADPYRRYSGTLRGLLKMLRGQIPSSPATAAEPSIVDDDDDDDAAVVSVYRYHGPTLRESHKALLKKTKRKSSSRRRRRAVVASSGDDESGSGVDAVVVPLLRHFTAFATAVERHKFVAFFVVQGIRNAGGVLCYSAHELKLRSILATDYHDAMMTFVLDVGSGGSGGGYGPGGTTIPLGSDGDGDGAFDEERGRDDDDDDDEYDHRNLHPFCRGTGFGLFPTTPFSVPTVLSLLNVTKIPAVVVMDASTGRIVARDAVLAIERNDGHGVINRWQSGKPGLSPWQQVGAVATCDCSHGPCCDGSGGNGNGGCCAIQ